MTLQETMKSDLKSAMKAKEEIKKDALRVILGEFQRQVKKELSDQEVICVVRTLIKSEKETLEKTDKKESPYLLVLESYLPKAPSEEEIREWISQNVDFSSFKNKIQAMKPIMAHFEGTVDGNTVKKILEGL